MQLSKWISELLPASTVYFPEKGPRTGSERINPEAIRILLAENDSAEREELEYLLAKLEAWTYDPNNKERIHRVDLENAVKIVVLGSVRTAIRDVYQTLGNRIRNKVLVQQILGLLNAQELQLEIGLQASNFDLIISLLRTLEYLEGEQEDEIM